MGRLKFRVHVISQTVFATAQTEANAPNSKVSEILGPQSLELRLRLTAEGSDTIEKFTCDAKRQYESVNGVTSVATGLYDDLFYYLSPKESMDSLTQSNDICYLLVKDIKKVNSGKKRPVEANGVTTNTPKPTDTDQAIITAPSVKKQKMKGGALPSKVDKKSSEEGNSTPASQDKQAASTGSSQSASGKVADRNTNKQTSKTGKVQKNDHPSQSKDLAETASTVSSAPKNKASKSTKNSQPNAQQNAQQKGKVTARETSEPPTIAIPVNSAQNGSPDKKVAPNSGPAAQSEPSSTVKQVEPPSRVTASTSEAQPKAAEPSFNLLQQTVSSQESASAAIESNLVGAIAKVPSPVEPMSPQNQTQARSDQDLSEGNMDDEGESEDEEEQEEARRADRVRRAKALSATRVSANTVSTPPARSTNVNKMPAPQTTSARKNSPASLNVKPIMVTKDLNNAGVEKSSTAAPNSGTFNQKDLRNSKQPELSLKEEKLRVNFVESGLSGFEALAKVRPTVHDNEKRPDHYQVLNDTQSSDEEVESSDSGSDEYEGDSDASSDEGVKTNSQDHPKRKRGGALSALRK